MINKNFRRILRHIRATARIAQINYFRNLKMLEMVEVRKILNFLE